MMPVTNRKPTEQTAPPNPMMPAQKSVICKSLGCARSLNQTQNFKRRNDAPLKPALSDSTDAPDTLGPERNGRDRQAPLMRAHRFPDSGDQVTASGGFFDDALHPELFQLLPGIARDRGRIDYDRTGITGRSAFFNQAEPIDAGHAKVCHKSFETLWIFGEFLQSIEAVVSGLHGKPGRAEGRLQRVEQEKVIVNAKDRRA